MPPNSGEQTSCSHHRASSAFEELALVGPLEYRIKGSIEVEPTSVTSATATVRFERTNTLGEGGGPQPMGWLAESLPKAEQSCQERAAIALAGIDQYRHTAVGWLEGRQEVLVDTSYSPTVESGRALNRVTPTMRLDGELAADV